MSRVMDAPDVRDGETAWEWHDGSTVYQRKCDSCEGGLLYAPARFCPRCSGSGYLLRFPEPS